MPELCKDDPFHAPSSSKHRTKFVCAVFWGGDSLAGKRPNGQFPKSIETPFQSAYAFTDCSNFLEHRVPRDRGRARLDQEKPLVAETRKRPSWQRVRSVQSLVETPLYGSASICFRNCSVSPLNPFGSNWHRVS